MLTRSVLVLAVSVAVLAAASNGVFSNLAYARWAEPSQSASEKRAIAAQTAQQPTTPPSGTPAQPAQTQKGPGWAVNCKSGAKDKALDCRLSQMVVTEQRQLLANVTFRFPAAPDRPEIIVQVPLGVLLSAGATIQVDENPATQLNFRACDRGGCYAQGPLSADFLAALRKGKQVSIAFKNLAEKDIKVPLSLDGFGDAYAKVPSS